MSENHRPDLHGQVEGSWRTGPPSDEAIAEALAVECPDCCVNVFLDEHPENDGEFVMHVAHDETCPWLAAHQEAE